MYLVLWQITYAWSLPFIRCSICLSLFRITNERRYTIPLWCVMVLATFSAMLGFIAVVITCQPIAKNWDPVLQNDPSVGSCMDYSIIQNISYFISASSILTDWSCVILPCIIVWNLNMKRKLKVSAAGILALGAVASLSTIVRLPHLGAYTAPKDHYYKIANIIIWSEIECGIGIIADPLPSLRGLIQAYLNRPSTGSSVEQNNHNDGHGNENGHNHHFVTIGGTGGERTAAMGSNLKLGNLNGGGRAEDNNNMILEAAAIAAVPVRESSI
ncbi:cation-transporting atpase 4 [Apiospora arundinis]|uniref:Cation-transporting atpase 4 n=1 Tax=Apiospora arundinis TaxID=335852 RepID=A0ABR2JMZ6_9PEZI